MGSTSFRCRLRFCYPYLATTLLEESSYSRSKNRGNNLAQPSPRSVRVMQSYSRFAIGPCVGRRAFTESINDTGSVRFSQAGVTPSGSFSTTRQGRRDLAAAVADVGLEWLRPAALATARNTAPR